MTTRKKLLRQLRRQLANVKEAQAMWATLPKKNVDLSKWRSRCGLDGRDEPETSPHTCGTVACFGGWVTAWPAFKAMGVKASFTGMPMFKGVAGQEVAELLFGDPEMFETSHLSWADQTMRDSASDHALVKNRLKVRKAEIEALLAAHD